MANQRDSEMLTGIQAIRLFWSVHDQRRRSSQLTQLVRSQNLSPEENASGANQPHDQCGTGTEEDLDELRFCRICRLSDDQLVENVCGCKGTMGHIHERCLRMWTIYKRSQMCEICHSKFRCTFERKLSVKLSNRTLVWNFFRRKYFRVLLRDLLNFMVLSGIMTLQKINILSLVEDDSSSLALPLALIGASFYDMYFVRWLMIRSVKAYNLIREYWLLANDDEFLGYFNEEYAVFGENQNEIENMLLAEYDASD